MVIFSFVTPVRALNRPNTGKEDDDDDCTGDKYSISDKSEKWRVLIHINLFM
jgi:hypothetical protein